MHEREDRPSNNIFQGFDVEILADAFGVDMETARKLQSQNDKRGKIVKVENGLQVVRPQISQEEEGREYKTINGLEETICSMRIRENLDDPQRADAYVSRAGRLSSLNSLNLPILRNLQLSAERGILYKVRCINLHCGHQNVH